MQIPFSPPYIDDSVIDEVVDTLKSGWITTGTKVKALEDEIRVFTGSEAVLCVNSWTSGAIMILKWLGVKEGDEVIVPAYTYCATALAVLHAGATPVMVDVNDDLNISLEDIRKAITPRTKAVIPVDVSGWPCDYKEIIELMKESEIKAQFVPESDVQKKLGRILVLNDAAHSIGAKYNGHSVGCDPDINIFSLHAVKNITTAEGGAICLNMPAPFSNKDLYAELRMMSLNCQTKDAFTKSKAGGWKYDIVGLGMKINMPDLNAALGLAQIRQYESLLANRKKISEYYATRLSQFEWAILPPQISKNKESSYHIFALRIKNINEEQRDQIMQLIAEKGIAVNVHFIPMPLLTFFKDLGYDIKTCPRSYLNYMSEISLPLYPQLTNEHVDFVIDTLVAAYNYVVGI